MTGQLLTPTNSAAFAVTADPNRFPVERYPENEAGTTFITVTNWFDDLLRRVPLKH